MNYGLRVNPQVEPIVRDLGGLQFKGVDMEWSRSGNASFGKTPKAKTPWRVLLADDDAGVRGSLAALVEWAPVAPELKDRDTEIGENSRRFRWKAVREQFAVNIG